MSAGYFWNQVWYVSSAKYTAVTAWAAATAYTVGQLRRPTAAAAGNERVYVCIVAGTSAASEPTWPLTPGGIITETGGVKWIDITGQPAMNGDAVNANTNPFNGVTLYPTYLAQGVGNITKDAAGTHYFVQTFDAGNNAASVPAWDTTALGNTTTDVAGSVWVYIGLVSSFTTAWAAPHARLETCVNNSPSYAISNCSPFGAAVVYIGHDHVQTQASSLTIYSQGQQPLQKIICVNTAGSMPPVSADLRTTAQINTTGASYISINGDVYYYGVQFNAAQTGGAVSADIHLFDGFAALGVMDNCSFSCGGTAGGSFIGGYYADFFDCTFTISASGVAYGFGIGTFRFKGGGIVGAAWASVAQVFGQTSNTVSFEDFDFTAAGAALFTATNNIQRARFILKNCKLPTAFNPISGNSFGVNAPNYHIINSDSAGATYRQEKYDATGKHVPSTIVVRTGGATDGVTPISWRAILNSLVVGVVNTGVGVAPFEIEPLAIWNSTAGSSVNVNVYGLGDPRYFAAMPTNREFWVDVQMLGTASSARGSIVRSKPDVLTPAVAISADTSAWDSAAPSRANSTVYAVGDIVKVSSNAGRVFICTAAGTSAGSLPGGYATAVDGGSVTDNTATFKAMWRFKITVAVTPQNVGLIYVYPKLAQQETWVSDPKTVYLDPQVVLS